MSAGHDDDDDGDDVDNVSIF